MLPYINKPFEVVAGALGASPDELKLIFSLILSYPLAGLLKRVPDKKPHYKNVFIIACGIFYLVGLFDLWGGLRTLFISAAGVYGLAWYMPSSPYMPWLGFVFLMTHMSVNQLKRQFANDPAVVDITGAQMVLVMKLSAFCWNVFDGTLPADQLSDFQKDRMLVKLPSLLDYTGYVLFFPSLLVGPSFDYNEYKNWIDCTMFKMPANIDPSKKPPTRKQREIPRSATPALLRGAYGLMWLFAFLQMSGRFYWQKMLSDEFLTYSFLHRVLFCHMVCFTTRFKYYAVWSLAEGSCILSGLGYNGVDPVTGKVAWDRLRNIDAWGVESAQNCRAYLANWNMNTNKWLRYYIYLRVTPRNRKPGFRASLATFGTSALWHGFYPGYYLTFVVASFVQTAAKNSRRYFRPFFLDPVTQKALPNKKYYDFASWFMTHFVFAFVTCPFVILNFEDVFAVWTRLYFYGIIVLAADMAFFAVGGKKWLKGTLERRKEEAGARLAKSSSAESLTALLGKGQEPILGIAADPSKEMDDLVGELRQQVERVKTGLEKKLEEENEKRRRAGIANHTGAEEVQNGNVRHRN